MDNNYNISKAVAELVEERQLRSPGERYTKFLNMYLPGENNYYRVEEDQNQNFEKIDGALENAQKMAIDLFSKKQDKTDSSLQTIDRTVVGAINENKKAIDNNKINSDLAIKNLDDRVDSVTTFQARPKLFWNSGNTISVGATSFYMNGFRFMGQQLKSGNKKYYVESSQLGDGNYSICNADADFEVCTQKPLNSWVGIFAVKTGDNTCRLKLVPFMQVLSVGGDYERRINLAKTTENTNASIAWDIGLNGNIADRDMLVVTKDNFFYGKIHKVGRAYGSNAILSDKVIGVTKGDHILIAPSDNEYVYLGSAYIDSAEFRNRSDNGNVVYSYGVKLLQPFKNGEIFETNFLNTISPLSQSAIIEVYFLSSNTKVGDNIVVSGGDSSHLFQKHATLYKFVGISCELRTGIIKDNFDKKFNIAYKIGANTANSEEGINIRVFGYDEF